MRNNKLFVLIMAALLSALVSFPLQAQSRILPVMESTASVRSMGMGHTTLGLAKEMHLYSNPAALIFSENIEKGAIGVSRELFPKTDVGTLTEYNVATSYKFAGTRAAFWGFRYQGGLRIPFASEEKNEAISNQLNPRECTVDLGYAFQVIPGIVVYAQGSYFSIKYATTAQGISFGAGVGYNKTFDTNTTTGVLTLAARLQDIGAGVKFDNKGLAQSLPTSVSLGGDYRQELIGEHYITLAVTGRYFTPRDADLFLIGMGLEYSYRDVLAARIGYRNGQREIAQWTVGLGGSYARFQLNTAYMISLRPETSPNILAVSLGYQF